MFFAAAKILVWFIYPLSLGVFLLILAYVAALLRKRASFHVLFWSGLLSIYLLSVGPVSDLLLKPLERKYISANPSDLKADAIVVLAGDLRKKVFPRHEVEVNGTRVIKGVRLYKEKAAPVMIMTGGSGDLFDQAFREAPLMQELAVEMGVPRDKILVEAESRNTRESAVYTKSILDKMKAKKIILVTSALHLPRSYALFKKVGIDTVPVTADFYATDQAYTPFSFIPHPLTLLRSSYAIHEYFGIFVYWLMGWI